MIIAKLLDDTTIELESGLSGNKLILEMEDRLSAGIVLDVLDRKCISVALATDTKEVLK